MCMKCDVCETASAYLSVITLFIEPWTLGFCAIILALAYTTLTPKMYSICVCVCVSGSRASLSSLSPLFSGLAYFLYCTVVLFFCMSAPQPVVATVDPLLCSPTFTVQEGNREPGQLLTTETRSDYAVVHLEEISTAFFHWLTTAKLKPQADVTMIDTSTVTCK